MSSFVTRLIRSFKQVVSASSSGVNEMLLDAIPKPGFQKLLVTTAGSIAFWAKIIHEAASSTVILLVYVLFCESSVCYSLSAFVHGDFRKWEVAAC